MALLFWDGYDHYNNVNDLQQRAGVVQYTGCSGGRTTGRNGNGSAWAGTVTGTVFQRLASHFIGAEALTQSDIAFYFNDTTTNQVQVIVRFLQRNFSIEVWQGNFAVLLYRTANNVWTDNVGNFIEIWPVISLAGGSVKVHVNQQPMLNITGQNTQNSANAWWDQFSIVGSTLDDFYYCDPTIGTGSNPCNDFLGDPRVYTENPTANAAVQFTPLANANWQEVSEQFFDADASYNTSGNVGDQDLFTIGAVPTTITGILGLQVTGAYRKDDAGLRQMNTVLKSGGSTVVGAARTLVDTNYVYWSEQFPVNPNGSVDWTRAALLAAEIGYKVAA